MNRRGSIVFRGFVMSDPQVKPLVNPVAVRNCFVKSADEVTGILDISFVRMVIESSPAWLEILSAPSVTLECAVDRFTFTAEVRMEGHGDHWIRLAFARLVLSAQANLRSFLSPKKVGESIIEDWRNEQFRHFHGLGESELWFDLGGGVFFSCLDLYDFNSQLIIQVKDAKAPLKVGKLLRKDYIAATNCEDDFALTPLNEKESYLRLGECRDIITNLRAIGSLEYNLKQRLLKLLSDHLYSTRHRVEPPRSPVRTVVAQG